MLAIENIHDLEIARAASEQGSFSAAARTLGITQPAVSQAIARLERQLGVTLFERQDSGRPGFLTDAGAVLLAHAITALDELDDAVGELAELEGGRPLCVGLSSLLASTYFPQGLDHLAQSQQGHPVEIVVHDSVRLYNELRLRHVDVGMIASAELGFTLPHVTFAKVASYPLMLGVRAKDRLPQGNLQLEALAEAQVPVIAFSGNLALREMTVNRLQYAGLRLNVVADTDQPEMLWRLVDAGMGVGLASELAFEGAPEDIRVIPLADAKSLQLHVFVFADTARLHGPDRKVLGALRRQLFDAVRNHANIA